MTVVTVPFARGPTYGHGDLTMPNLDDMDDISSITSHVDFLRIGIRPIFNMALSLPWAIIILTMAQKNKIFQHYRNSFLLN